MGILKQGNLSLNSGSKGDKGDKGDAGSGAISPNIYVVDELSDITGDQSANSNKIWEVQANIDLGTTTINIPSNVILKYGGGIISNGTINSVNNDTYISNDNYKQFFGLDITFTGKFNFRAVFPEWFGGGVNVTENILPFRKMIELIDISGGGRVEVNGSGYYDFSSNPLDGYWGKTSTGDGFEGIIEIHDNTDFIVSPTATLRVVDNGLDVFNLYPIATGGVNVGTLTITLDNSAANQEVSPQPGMDLYINDVLLGTIVSKSTPNYTLDVFNFTPQDGDFVVIKRPAHTRLIKFDRSKNSRLEGGYYEGNWDITGNLDQPSGIRFYGMCDGVTISNVDVSKFPADALNAQIETNYQSDATNVYELGSIDSTTGADVASTTRVRSVNTFNLSESKIQENGKFMISQQTAYHGIADVPNGKVNLYFYDNSDNFLGARLSQYMYEYIDLIPNASYLKIVIASSNVNGDYNIDAKAYEVPRNITIENNKFHHNGRQGWSVTGFQDTYFINNEIYEIRGFPGAAIDFEDGRYLNRRVYIDDNTIWNCELGLIAYNPVQIYIRGNTILRNRNYVGATETYSSGLSIVEKGGLMLIKDNYIEHCRSICVREVTFEGNIFSEAKIEVTGGNIINNRFVKSSTLDLKYATDTRFAAPILAIGNTFENSSITMDILSSVQYPSFLKNTILNGQTTSNVVNLKKGLIIEDITLLDVNEPRIDTPNVNGLKTDSEVVIWYAPVDNETVYYKDWKITDEQISIRGTGGSLKNWVFDNLEVERTPTYTGTGGVFGWVEQAIGRLTLKNMYLNDASINGMNGLSIPSSAKRVSLINSKIIAKNTIDLITPTGAEDAVIMGNDFTNVTINNLRVGDHSINNIVDGVLATD